MRGASGELQRQSPSTAAERGERAAADLRRLEQQMRRDDPAAGQRAAGELRLEAQQVADEQRRIAGEAARLEKGAEPADRDGWRRLSGEKDKLADRVDALQRSAEQLGGKDGKSTRGARPPTRAAQEIGPSADLPGACAKPHERCATRLPPRPPADVPASHAVPQGAAAAEQQLARALDQIADGLGGGAADAAELSRELDRSRAIRDRLDRLERDAREADDRSAAAGRQGQGRAAGNGAGDEAQRLREQYGKELQSTREALSRLERGSPGSGLGGGSPEEHEWSAVDQGTEAFKQDFSKWDSLAQGYRLGARSL